MRNWHYLCLEDSLSKHWTMKAISFKILVLLALTSLFWMSCEKEEDDQDDTPDLSQIDYQLVARDLSTSDNINSEVFNTVDNEARHGDESNNVGKTSGIVTWTSSIDTCAVVTLDLNGGNFPMNLSIDFGAGCTDIYNIERKGIINATFSGRYTDAGTEVTVTFNNYFVNGHKVEGTKTITNQGRNNDGNLEFTVVDANGVITKPDGGQVTWESTRTHTWIEGEGTIFNICDDTYAVVGVASGEASDGTPYGIEVTATDPITKTTCCPYITDGTVTYSVYGTDVADIDFGTTVTGFSCESTATATFNGQTFVIGIQ